MRYTVVKGDIISQLALRYLGDAKRWPEIKILNRDVRGRWNNRDRIYPGDVLEIPMAMSKDRVEFNLTDYDKQEGATLEAACRAFGMEPHEARQAYHTGQRIRCRPSQFARFLIWRSEKVEVNRFACLNAVLIEPEPEKPQPLDVSARPRR